MINNDCMFFYADARDFILAYTRRGASTAISRTFPKRLSKDEVRADKRPVRFYMRNPFHRLKSCLSLKQTPIGSIHEITKHFIETDDYHWNPLSNYECLATDIRHFSRIKELNLPVMNESKRHAVAWELRTVNLIRNYWGKDLEWFFEQVQT